MKHDACNRITNESYPPSFQRLHRSILRGSNVEGIHITHHIIIIAADHATGSCRSGLDVTTAVHDSPAAREMAPPLVLGAASRLFPGITNGEKLTEETEKKNQPRKRKTFPAAKCRSLLLEIPNIEFFFFVFQFTITGWDPRSLFSLPFSFSTNNGELNQNKLHRKSSLVYGI